MLAGLLDSLIGSQTPTATTEFLKHKEENRYGVPFTDLDEDDLPAVMYSDDLKNDDDADDELRHGAVLANPLYGLDSDEEETAPLKSEDPSADDVRTSEEAGKGGSDDTDEVPSADEQGSEGENTPPNRMSLVEEDQDQPADEEDEEEESLDDDGSSSNPIIPLPAFPAAEVSSTPSPVMDSPATKIARVLPLRQSSIALKANEKQQLALARRSLGGTFSRLLEEDTRDSTDGVWFPPPPPLSFSNLVLIPTLFPPISQHHVKIHLGKKDFLLDVNCADVFLERRRLLGTTNGLYQLDKAGNLLKIIAGVNFQQIHVLSEFGVMMALVVGKMSIHIRMYSLALISQAAQNGKAPSSFPFTKLSGTKSCSHFALGMLFFSRCRPLPSFLDPSPSNRPQNTAERTSIWWHA